MREGTGREGKGEGGRRIFQRIYMKFMLIYQEMSPIYLTNYRAAFGFHLTTAILPNR